MRERSAGESASPHAAVGTVPAAIAAAGGRTVCALASGAPTPQHNTAAVIVAEVRSRSVRVLEGITS